ncbi:MAG: hypothetical protein IJT49_03990 [Clostridia bacterium]|nr:hypothetical protein [Clostridia bacterium]
MPVNKFRLSNKLKIVLDHLDENPVISVTYFLLDKKKSGGSGGEYEGWNPH